MRPVVVARRLFRDIETRPGAHATESAPPFTSHAQDSKTNYQTRQPFSRTMGWPDLQWKASRYSGMFATTPLARYLAGECGSTVARRRLFSSRSFSHQLWP